MGCHFSHFSHFSTAFAFVKLEVYTKNYDWTHKDAVLASEIFPGVTVTLQECIDRCLEPTRIRVVRAVFLHGSFVVIENSYC